MRPPRFYMSDSGLIFETPIALTIRQRYAVSQYAIQQYKDRHRKEIDKEKKQKIEDVIRLISKGIFLERIIPKFDCDKEVTIYGQ